jgi:hypothetical protein
MNTLIVAAIRCSLIFIVPTVTYATSAQWDLDPISGDWNTDANWTPNEVPNGPADVATFGLSNTTSVSISANTEVNGIIFTPAATSSYIITKNSVFTLTISGTGIVNNSGFFQKFVTNGGPLGGAGQISFTNSATAGSFTMFTNHPGTTGFIGGGHTSFFNTSTAGTAIFINESIDRPSALEGSTLFFDSSTAGKGIFINKGSATIGLGNGGTTGFVGISSAGQATITNNGGVVLDAGGGSTFFGNSSTAASATITNNAGMVSEARGGGVLFAGNATAANAVVINKGGVASGAFGGNGFLRQLGRG